MIFQEIFLEIFIYFLRLWSTFGFENCQAVISIQPDVFFITFIWKLMKYKTARNKFLHTSSF